MSNLNTTFGIPDNLPPLTLRELNAYLWFGVIGVLLMTAGVIPDIAAARWALVAAMGVWVLIPALAWWRRPDDDPRHAARKAIAAQIRLYIAVVLAFSIAFAIWARQLNVAWPIVIGALFLVDAFANIIASLTEWWRLSMFGHSVGLLICGFAYPVIDKNKLPMLVGSAVLVGSILSAGILYCQVRNQQASLIADVAVKDAVSAKRQ